MNGQTKQIVMYALIATVVFVAIYLFYQNQNRNLTGAGTESDGESEPTGKENVASESAGYDKPKTESEEA